ncbi:GNAT family N-acetyltransferase [Chitinophaga sp. S165]|uniref:GNAT family N-acetyltransferase n=1 Tax=Chitinophaga sp. S165 TaxID=2135462 RepID=UPI0011B64E06|nr:GNAT family N-acetyltransferase [Chitinophaga sp. S165]
MSLPEPIHITEYTSTWRQQCLDAFISNVPDYFTEAEVSQYENWLDLFVAEKEHSHYYVAISGKTLVGCGGFGYDEKKNEVTFAWGLVDRKFHKQGFGKQLLIYRLSKIRELYPGASIILDTTQHSRPFFERYGFVTVKYTENGYSNGMHRYDMILTVD